MNKPMQDIYIYTRDGSKKVNLTQSTLLGDVYVDKHICRQGDRAQLWRTRTGQYFTGMCLDQVLSHANPMAIAKHYFPVLISKSEARDWVTCYYGGDELPRFGFDDIEEV